MKSPIIILHGWGLYGEKYRFLQQILEKNGYKVFAPDFPGFGSQPLEKPIMTLDDYCNFLYEFYQKHHVKKAILIGHSFGGRVSVKFALTHPSLVEKIVISGSPIIRPTLNLKKKAVQAAVKKGTIMIHFAPKFVQKPLRWLIYRLIGEWDYYKAEKLRETFKAIINEDLVSYIEKISQPVLVLWGSQDKLVPVEIALQVHERNKGSKKVIIEDAGHGVPYTHPELFANEVLEFLKS